MNEEDALPVPWPIFNEFEVWGSYFSGGIIRYWCTDFSWSATTVQDLGSELEGARRGGNTAPSQLNQMQSQNHASAAEPNEEANTATLQLSTVFGE
jgi:hypothetical protein